jgi:hypothetical protein
MNFFEKINEDFATALVLRSRNTTVMMPGMSTQHLSTTDLSIDRSELRCAASRPSAADMFHSNVAGSDFEPHSHAAPVELCRLHF